MKIFVAIPTYDGKLPIQVVSCLLQEQIFALVNGDELVTAFLPSCSAPSSGRNQLAQNFLDSGCDKLFFLDSDITFQPGSILKVAHHNAEIVGGAYRFKHQVENYPVEWIDGPLYANAQGLLEVKALPTGFMAISRSVFEKLRAAYPGREYEQTGHKAYCFFQQFFKNGAMHSDDMTFCREWTDIGGKIFLDPEIELTHWDFNPTPHKGHIGQWLKSMIKEAV
jgi:hypothetical protein